MSDYGLVVFDTPAYPLDPEWPVLLRVWYSDSSGNKISKWGTGFLVQVAPDEVTEKPSAPTSAATEPTRETSLPASTVVTTAGRFHPEALRAQEKMEFKRKSPEVYAETKQKRKHAEEKIRQAKDNWRVGHQRVEGGFCWLFLVTNEHVLRPDNHDAAEIQLHFCPRHGGDRLNVVTITMPQSEGAPPPTLIRTTCPRDSDPNNKPKDVAVLLLTMIKGTPIRCGKPPRPLGGPHIPRPPFPAQISEKVFCAGFPVLKGEELGTWEYRQPQAISCRVTAVGLADNHFRVSGHLMWGMSGSLVLRYNKADKTIQPLGVFSHIKFAADERYDSSIRVVWVWSHVENLTGVRPGQKAFVVYV